MAYLHKMFLFLQGLLDLIISHAEHTQFSLLDICTFSEHNKLGHEGDVDSLSVQLCCHFSCFVDVLTIHQPESGNRTNIKKHINNIREKNKRKKMLWNNIGCFTDLADTVVVKDTQSWTKVRGVVPVISSH